MPQSYTHIMVILDRTGSMESIREDTIGGYNSFIERQKDASGPVTITLVQFDSQDPYEVIHKFLPIQKAPPLTGETYVPRASTPLLDALGRGINDLEQSQAKMPKHARPDKILFVVVTDGQENASHEFNRDQIMEMIANKKERLNWQFVFLSADLSAIGEARDLGVHYRESLLFEKSARGSQRAWESLSGQVSEYMRAPDADFCFSPLDRQSPEDVDPDKA